MIGQHTGQTCPFIHPVASHFTTHFMFGTCRLPQAAVARKMELIGYGGLTQTLPILLSLTSEQDVIMSVLEISATRRDAKGYLQKYAPKKPDAIIKSPEFVQGKQQQQDISFTDEPLHVAITKLRDPQVLDQETLLGVAKTLVQLRLLGLLSLVVLDCGAEEARGVFEDQALRMCEAIDSFGKNVAKLVDDVFIGTVQERLTKAAVISNSMYVDDRGVLSRTLQKGHIPVIPTVARSDDLTAPQPTDAHPVMLALTRFLTGLQFKIASHEPTTGQAELHKPGRIAAVERIIILDPLGGTPVTGRPGASQRFVNLEQEYESLFKHLMGPEGSPMDATDQSVVPATAHAANLTLAKHALSILPPSASALITTPWAVANTTAQPAHSGSVLLDGESRLCFDGMVTTRRKQNVLLHNLLTDKPVYSSSLPVQRVQDGGHGDLYAEAAAAATLVKRGMPVTIYPDPRISPWSSPRPGSPRLRLTDKCIDLPRLVHLIQDSFGRKLDVQHYMERISENLAGIIIAGEYEGGAILTWECPNGLSNEEAFETGRLIPYLDKFAVLRSRQGSGGVADIVFNAMVQDCFPGGVCWRSRKDNPVNKWYFERSSGTAKLSDSNWTMFWTKHNLVGRDPILQDYESVCRSVEPSWADNKHILD